MSLTPVISEEGPVAGSGVTLYRRSFHPRGQSWARLAIVHGYGDHSGRHVHFMHWLAGRGVACEAVDLRGQGAASGRRGYVRRWEDYLQDVRTLLALPAAAGQEDLPLFVLGHSHGGLIVAAAGIDGPLAQFNVQGCILSAPFFRSRLPAPRKNLLLARLLNPIAPWFGVRTGLLPQWMSSDPAMVCLDQDDPLRCLVATPRWYLGLLRVQRQVMERAERFRLPLLMLIAGADPIADPAAEEQFFQNAGSGDKSRRVYPDHRHEPLREVSRESVFEDVLAWLKARTTAATHPSNPAARSNAADSVPVK